MKGRDFQKTVNFAIDHIDGLGQGVSKISDKITFISKTLPGETGQAQVISQKKGVQFATVAAMERPSNKRLTPSCPHFEDCPSCHFLHTDYQTELGFKKNHLERLLGKIALLGENFPLQVIAAPKRSQYRNRIQLHYDLALDRIGQIDPLRNIIVPIPNCCIGDIEVQKFLQGLYFENSWKSIIKQSGQKASQGYLTIYNHPDNGISTSVNQYYASGGFSQVNQSMAEVLRESVSKLVDSYSSALGTSNLVDLFGGNGNLSGNICAKSILCVDKGQQTAFARTKNKGTNFEYLDMNLYHSNAAKSLMAQLPFSKVDGLILDPPRTGLDNLHDFLKCLDPDFCIYVSCNPNTLQRDLQNLHKHSVDRYIINQTILIDLFPSTFHFETIIGIKKK